MNSYADKIIFIADVTTSSLPAIFENLCLELTSYIKLLDFYLRNGFSFQKDALFKANEIGH